jgi:hypothetical protein
MGIVQLIAQAPATQSPPVLAARSSGTQADALEAALADMMACLSGDFVNGEHGDGQSSNEHRTRVLRQMAERLTAMRELDDTSSQRW